MIYDIGTQIDGNDALIGIQSWAHFDSLSTAESSAAEASWPLAELTNDNTYGGYRPAAAGPATAEVAFDFVGPATVNYLGIAAHTLGTNGCTLRLYLGDDDGMGAPVWDLAEVFEITPADDSPILVIFPEASRQWAKIEVDYGADKFKIGVLRIGERLVVQRRIYANHSPTTLSRVTATRPLMSETGQFIGRAAIRHGLRGSYAWSNLDAAWYRSDFDPFVEQARYRAFFLAWRPVTYPSEVVYGQVPPAADIAPTNNGRAGLMDVTVPVEAHDWESVT